VAVRITGVNAYLPPDVLTSEQVEARIAAASPGYTPRPGAIRKLTGIDSRHRARDDEKASDLAVAASVKLLSDRGLDARDVDLLVFAAASQDVLEPATAHVVAAKLGVDAPVFDVKNACNSFLNGIQVAEALIESGQHSRALVCCGETGSRAVRWQVADRAEFVDSFAGYTLSDAGAAMLLERSDQPGIRYRRFHSESTCWDISTVPGSGAANLRDDRRDGYIRGSGYDLKRVVLDGAVREHLDGALAEAGLTRDDIAVFCVHQVATPYLRAFRDAMAIPADKLVVTVADHGNVASCTLPLQLTTALASGHCGPGDTVALIGLAGGISVGIVFVEL
jgi:3-oxoacyl-[acyl-carrier-protein] synthase-3